MSSTLPRREPRLTGSPPVSGRAEKAYTVDCAAAESRAAHILEMLGLKHRKALGEPGAWGLFLPGGGIHGGRGGGAERTRKRQLRRRRRLWQQRIKGPPPGDAVTAAAGPEAEWGLGPQLV